MAFIPIDFPREVLELASSGQRGWRRLVKNNQELEKYWSGKNGAAMYISQHTVTMLPQPPSTIVLITIHLRYIIS